jgi:integrase
MRSLFDRYVERDVLALQAVPIHAHANLGAEPSDHQLRHTSQLLDDAMPLPVVSARLGHSSIRTTQEIYAHMIHGQDDAAADRWDEYQKRHALPAVPGARKDRVQ